VALVEGAHKSGQAILDWFRHRIEDEGLIAPHHINQTFGTIPCSGLRDTLRIGQVIIAGDAAGTAHPLGVMGISPAVESGCMAGRAAAGMVQGDGDALRGYEWSMRRWLSPTHTRALDRRQFMEGAWKRIDFNRLMREIVGELSPSTSSGWRD
jgi:flavin-dependent dehydrogenase